MQALVHLAGDAGHRHRRPLDVTQPVPGIPRTLRTLFIPRASRPHGAHGRVAGTLPVVMILAALALSIAVPVFAATGGGISSSLLERLDDLEVSEEQQAVADIVANGDLNAVALNRQRYISHRPLVSFRIKTGGITSQKASGRCWMFAGFNVLRPEVMRRFNVKDFEFSQNHLEFWDKMEKSNLFLQQMIDHCERPLDDRYVEILLDDPLGDGGWWSYFVDLVEKYGVVPKEVMPETHNSSSTGLMNKLVGLKLMELGLELRDRAAGGERPEVLEDRKEEMLLEIYGMLALNLGRPPSEFQWRYATGDSTQIAIYPETLTPKSFYEKAVGIDLRSYVALFNYPGKEFLQTYSLEMSRNLYDRTDFTLLNVPVDTLRSCAFRSVLDSAAVWFACDVGQDNYGKDGILALDIYNYEGIYGARFGLSKQHLIQLGLITPNHAMTFIGVDTVGTKVEKWLVENSWGDERGDKGLWYMYNDWFDRYMFGAIIHERYLSPPLREAARMPPIVLPPWDPMYALNRLNGSGQAGGAGIRLP